MHGSPLIFVPTRIEQSGFILYQRIRIPFWVAPTFLLKNFIHLPWKLICRIGRARKESSQIIRTSQIRTKTWLNCHNLLIFMANEYVRVTQIEPDKVRFDSAESLGIGQFSEPWFNVMKKFHPHVVRNIFIYSTQNLLTYIMAILAYLKYYYRLDLGEFSCDRVVVHECLAQCITYVCSCLFTMRKNWNWISVHATWDFTVDGWER